jgi:hypothetical protein
MQAQALLILSIPNYLPSRQGKSLELLHPFSTASNKNGNLQNNQYGYPPLADFQFVAAMAAAAAGQAYRN